MKELEDLVDDLQNYLKAKEAELRQLSGFNLYTEGSLANRKREIEGFEIMSKNCEANPFHKLEVIANFTKNAETIKKEIDKISC